MSWVGYMVATPIVAVANEAAANFVQLLIFPLGAIFGFVPVFMYGAWLSGQLRHSF
jgi:hypothetical protein